MISIGSVMGGHVGHQFSLRFHTWHANVVCYLVLPVRPLRCLGSGNRTLRWAEKSRSESRRISEMSLGRIGTLATGGSCLPSQR